jgi:hypothetical protein
MPHDGLAWARVGHDQGAESQSDDCGDCGWRWLAKILPRQTALGPPLLVGSVKAGLGGQEEGIVVVCG